MSHKFLWIFLPFPQSIMKYLISSHPLDEILTLPPPHDSTYMGLFSYMYVGICKLISHIYPCSKVLSLTVVHVYFFSKWFALWWIFGKHDSLQIHKNFHKCKHPIKVHTISISSQTPHHISWAGKNKNLEKMSVIQKACVWKSWRIFSHPVTIQPSPSKLASSLSHIRSESHKSQNCSLLIP